MSEQRRATVMIIQRGDPEIAGALLDGMIAGRAKAVGDSLSHGCAATAPSGREPFGGDAQGVESVEIVTVERDKSATAPSGREPFGGDVQGVESVEIVTVERDKWRRVARQVHVAVGRNLTTEDYRMMIVKARCDYAVHTRPGPLHTFAGKLLLAWALICEGIRRAYRAQDRVLKP